MKQTSIDWLQEQIFLKDNYNNIRLGGKKIILELFEKAKEMHKQEIIKAVEWSVDTINEQEKAISKEVNEYEPSFHELSSDDYYNITFKQTKL
jgi:hypothetical protein